MAGRWGRVDFRELQALERRIDRLEKADFDKFCREAAKELALRLKTSVVKRTPVGVYYPSSGKKGGTLRRGWTIGEVVKEGGEYRVEIVNPVEYASYVEYGHRQTPGRYVPALGKRLTKGWVPGAFYADHIRAAA